MESDFRQTGNSAATNLLERVMAGMLYLFALCGVVVFGVLLVDREVVAHCVKDYLMGWEVAALQYNACQGDWPVLTGAGRHAYMTELAGRMAKLGVDLPKSNLDSPWRYRVSRLGSRSEDIFLLLLPGKILIYGLSPESATVLESIVAGPWNARGARISINTGMNERQVVVKWLR